MADDLRHWLEDKPIQARRPSMLQVTRRWARRHRALIVSMGVCLLVAVVALAITTIVIWQKQRETNAAYKTAARERQKAINSLKDAQAAVDQLLHRVGKDKLKGVPHMEQLRRELLTDALGFYQKFLNREHDDPELRLETARAHVYLGIIQQTLGESQPAEENVRQGIALVNQLPEAQSSLPECQDLLVEGWSALGQIRLEMSRIGETEEAFHTARTIAAQMVAQQADSQMFLHHLARACANLATTYARSSRPKQAAELYREALSWGEQLTTKTPGDLSSQQTLATVAANLGTLLDQMGQNEEGEKRLRQAVAIQENVVAKEPGPKQRAYLANFYRDLGLGQGRRGRFKEAVEILGKAIDLWSQLHNEFPRLPDYAQSYGRVLLFTGRNLMYLGGRDRTALNCLSEAERLYAQLVKDFPEKHEYRRELSWCCCDLGWLLATSFDEQVRNPIAALEPARRAIEFDSNNSKSWVILGMAYYRVGKWEDALQALNQAHARPQPAERVDLLFLAMTHAKLGNKQQAVKWYGEAQAFRQKHVPNSPLYKHLSREASQLIGIPEPLVVPAKEKATPNN
jgi:tetratricopeptide (TPR) repeat protein